MMELLKFIPPIYHDFFNNLETVETQNDDAGPLPHTESDPDVDEGPLPHMESDPEDNQED